MIDSRGYVIELLYPDIVCVRKQREQIRSSTIMATLSSISRVLLEEAK